MRDALLVRRMRRQILPLGEGPYSVLHGEGILPDWIPSAEGQCGAIAVEQTQCVTVVQDSGVEIEVELTAEGLRVDASYRVPRSATRPAICRALFCDPFPATLVGLSRDIVDWEEILDTTAISAHARIRAERYRRDLGVGGPVPHPRRIAQLRPGPVEMDFGPVQIVVRMAADRSTSSLQPERAPAPDAGPQVPGAVPGRGAGAPAQPDRRESRNSGPAHACPGKDVRPDPGDEPISNGTRPKDGKMTHTTILIIGSGPAGCTAAIYAARAGLDPVMLEGLQPGGQLTITDEVENYPPFASTTGPGLMSEMKAHVTAAGTDIRSRIADRLDREAETGFFVATLDDGSVIHAETVVLATGAKAKWLGIPSEAAFMGRGVSACATCDGFFYRGKEVLVVGGGNTAVEEALYLSNLAAKVTVIHRRDSFRAEKILQDRLFARENVEVVWNSEIDEILGDEMGVTGARVRCGDASVEIPAHGVFVAIGHAPETAVVAGLVDRDQSGYVLVKPGATITSCPGLFAAGDVSDPVYRQAITSAGFGCMAALDAEKYLAGRPVTQVVAA